MARTLKQIKDELTSRFISEEGIQSGYGLIDGLTFEEQFSLVSIENILFTVISFGIFVLEQLFDKHNYEIDDKLKNQKKGRLAWYRFMALEFQYGFTLIPDTDFFDNTGQTAEAIANSKVVKNASVAEGDKAGVIVVKVSSENNGVLSPLDDEVIPSIKAYFEEIKMAGTRISIVNFLPDKLRLNIEIYRNALVLNGDGESILNGDRPVEIALNEFLRELPFNGELVLQDLVDKLQSVSGVKIVNVIGVETSYITGDEGYGDYEFINVKRVPFSGYFTIVNFDNIAYVV